jgi:protein-disulfide isomerase
LQDLDAIALKTNMKLAQSLYDARRAAIDQVIMERLLASEAAAQKITVEQLISKRIAEKIQPVTGADVETYYKANSARMGGKTIEQVSEQIQSFLTAQKEKVARDNLLGELKQKVEVKITLDAPRVEVPIAANDPAKGPKDAKVKVVVFSDFQ